MTTQKTISRAALLIILIILAGYAYFEARPYLSGPQLSISEPHDGFVTTESPMLLSGTARRITEITLNGNPIFINEDGAFQQLVTLSPGYAVITVAVKDRYGRTRTETLRGIYAPSQPLPPESAFGSSTQATSTQPLRDLDAATTTGTL